MEPIRVLLADEQGILRNGLKLLLETQTDLTVVGGLGGDDGHWTLSPDSNADVILMSVTEPGFVGAERINRFKSADAESRILILAGNQDPSYLKTMLGTGVHGYILNRSTAEDLFRALRTVANGGTYIDPTLAGSMWMELQAKASSPANISQLSEREGEVLKLVSQGYALKTIASQLDVGVRTIETYKTRGMEKLGLRSRADLVRYAAEKGWLTSI
jgi:DNA-binding NarL/FixJ family response regulator